MAADFDAKLTGLAAGILRDAVQLYSQNVDETWLSGFNPVLTAWNSGMFGSLKPAGSFRTRTDSPYFVGGSAKTMEPEFGEVGGGTLREPFCLPPRLPAVQLPSPSELARLARSAPLMRKLEELARWVGRAGRPVTPGHHLHDADAAEAIDQLDIRPNLLPYLWRHALATGWFELVDGQDGRRSWVVLGSTAYRWMDGDSLGALHVWATVFASVLTRTLEVTADEAPEASRLLNFQGQGVALAVILFLARGTGVTVMDASDIVRDGAIGDPAFGRPKRAWDAWVRKFGDPARSLLRELAALRALSLPSQDDGILILSPLAQWALREQFMLDGIVIRAVPASQEMSVADLVELMDGVSDAEFNEGFEAWASRRAPGRAARDLLMYAASVNTHERLIAINLVRRIGRAAGGAWIEAMDSPQLRGYAYVALSIIAADPPESRPSMLRRPGPEDLNCIAVDLISLVGDGHNVNPEHVEVSLAEVIPAGQEGWVLELLARGSNPNTMRLLTVLGRYHPNRDIARGARKAQRATARHRPAVGPAHMQARNVNSIGHVPTRSQLRPSR